MLLFAMVVISAYVRLLPGATISVTAALLGVLTGSKVARFGFCSPGLMWCCCSLRHCISLCFLSDNHGLVVIVVVTVVLFTSWYLGLLRIYVFYHFLVAACCLVGAIAFAVLRVPLHWAIRNRAFR